MKYQIKCDQCKKEIGRSNNMRDSVAGGLCDDCRQIADFHIDERIA